MHLPVHTLVLHPAGTLGPLASILPSLARVVHSLAWILSILAWILPSLTGILPSLAGILAPLAWILAPLAWILALARLCRVHPGGGQGLRLDAEAGHPLALAAAVGGLGREAVFSVVCLRNGIASKVATVTHTTVR